MKDPAVLIPFKSNEAKSRLALVLNPATRRKLAETMLTDVLGAVKSARLQRNCHVVTSDPEALKIAEEAGVSSIREPSDRGVNEAVEKGMEVLKGEESFLVIPSDLPLLKGRELRRAVSLGTILSCVISPSKSFDGTNLFLFPRKQRMALSYDSNSFWTHVGGAGRKRISLAVYCSRGVLFDVDSTEDLLRLGRARINTATARFARKALSQWDS